MLWDMLSLESDVSDDRFCTDALTVLQHVFARTDAADANIDTDREELVSWMRRSREQFATRREVKRPTGDRMMEDWGSSHRARMRAVRAKVAERVSAMRKKNSEEDRRDEAERGAKIAQEVREILAVYRKEEEEKEAATAALQAAQRAAQQAKNDVEDAASSVSSVSSVSTVTPIPP